MRMHAFEREGVGRRGGGSSLVIQDAFESTQKEEEEGEGEGEGRACPPTHTHFHPTLLPPTLLRPLLTLPHPRQFRMRTGSRFCCADEHYVQILLHMRDPSGISGFSTTFADWSAAEWHPKLFTGDNITAHAIRSIKVRLEWASI
ncbi:unnamed protein product [Closterium sp. NIES-53]